MVVAAVLSLSHGDSVRPEGSGDAGGALLLSRCAAVGAGCGLSALPSLGTPVLLPQLCSCSGQRKGHEMPLQRERVEFAVPGQGEGQPHTWGRGMVPLASPSSMEIRASSRDTNQPEVAPSAFLLNVEMKMWV